MRALRDEALSKSSFDTSLIKVHNTDMRNFIGLGLLITMSSMMGCSAVKKIDPYRSYQTDIMIAINEQGSAFSQCATKHNIYETLKATRIPLTLHLTLSSKGEIEKFRLDEKDYPAEFLDCFFATLELIKFPKNDKFKSIEIQQPFIFSKK